jgi:hypothetical protein
MRGRIVAGIVIVVAAALVLFLLFRDRAAPPGEPSPRTEAARPSAPPVPIPRKAAPGGPAAPPAGAKPDDGGEGDDAPMQGWWEGHIRSVRARVVAAEDGRPLAAATVELTPEGKETLRAETGADGTVGFHELPEVEFDLVAHAPGRVRGLAAVSQTDVGGKGERDEDGAVLFSLAKGVMVEGVVVAAEDRRPLAGVRVTAVSGGHAGSEKLVHESADSLGASVTDAAGRFRSVPVYADRWLTLIAEHPEFREGETSLRPADLPGREGPLEIALEGAASVRGIVLGSDGRPFEGATVWAVPVYWDDNRDEEDRRWIRYPEGNRPGDALSRGAGGRAVSAKDGTFAIGSLAPGEVHRVYAAVGEEQRSPLTEATTPAFGSVAVGELRLLNLRRVFVRVEGPDGGAPEKAEVTIAPLQGPWPEDHEDDPQGNGRYRFEEVLPGEYRLGVQSPDLEPGEAAVRVEVGRDAETTVRLGKGLSVDGLLVDDAGAAVPEAAIYAYRLAGDGSDPDAWDDTEEHRQSKTGEGGRFRVEGLRAGWYRLSFSSPDGGDVDLPRVQAPTTGLRPVVTRTATVLARIAVPEGAKPPSELHAGMTTHYDGGGIESGGGDSSFDGTVLRCTGVRPGRNELRLDPPGFAPVTRSFEAVPGQTVDLGVIALSSGVTVAGRVVDGTAKPVAGAKVGPEWFGPEPSVTDAEGRFRLEHMPEGDLRLDVEAAGYARIRVTVTVRAPATETVVRLSRGGIVRGKVLREGEARRLPTTLCFRTPGAGKYDYHPETWTDDKGAYEIRLPPGKYAVAWYLQGAEGPAGTVEVAEGSEQTLDVVVPAK